MRQHSWKTAQHDDENLSTMRFVFVRLIVLSCYLDIFATVKINVYGMSLISVMASVAKLSLAYRIY